MNRKTTVQMKDFSYTKQMQGEKKNEKLSLLVTSALNTLCFSELLWTHFFNPTWPIQPKSRVFQIPHFR